MTATVTIPRRFRGPSESGNGGYTAGTLAALLGGPVEVTLRVPPPLERPLRVEERGEGLALLDGEVVVAEARPAAVDVEPPAPVSWADAVDAATRYAGFDAHAFPECFACGPARAEGDGLRIFPGSVAGREGLLAAPWVAREPAVATVWAAIDCAGAFAVGFAARGETVLGRMTAEVSALPREGERCVVLGWPLGGEGRKLFAGTALFSADGELRARSRQIWIVPRG